MKLMGWLVLEDKDWYLLTNQLMGHMKKLRQQNEDKETHMCGGQPFLVLYLYFKEEKGGYFHR
jgi:hypothetical protein